MAAPYNPPIRAQDFVFGIGLQDMSASGALKANPTIAAGDFKISKDFGAFANLATLPTVSPASGTQVQISLSATEMTADNVTITCIDQTSPKEWADMLLNIVTCSS